MDELLYDYLLHVSTCSSHSVIKCLTQLIGTVDGGLPMTAGGHEGLYDTGETYLLRSLHQLFVGGGIEVFCCAQSQFPGSKVSYSLTVHGVVYSSCRWHHLYALLFKIKEAFCAYGLHLWHYDVWLVLAYHSREGIAIKHGEHLTLVCHLHGRSIGITITRNDVHACTLGCYNKFLTQFART